MTRMIDIEDLYHLSYEEQQEIKVGEGATRIVFIHKDPRYVIKYAKNEGGLKQNLAEKIISSDPKCSGAFAKVYSNDPEYKWIISEKFVPFKSEDDFFEKISFDFYDMISFFLGNTPDCFSDDLINKFEITASEFRYAIDRYYLEKGDIDFYDHWGCSSINGRLAMIDYGYARYEKLENYISRI